MDNKLIVSISPHIHSGVKIDRIMWHVIAALMPALAVALWVFGAQAGLTLAVSVSVCVATEYVIDRWLLRRPQTITDGSAIITGLLLGFNLPSILPWWMTAIGAIVAIGIGKMSFGGLGCNIWNPALVGRVFLLLSFPAAMTTWPTGIESGIDGISGATILTSLNHGNHDVIENANMLSMAVGHMNGSLGETGAIAIILGGLWLLFKRIISWHIPVSVLGAAAILSWALGGNPLLDLLSGGLLLGAIFMATDYVTSPMSRPGQLIFGSMIGVLTIIIRRFGAYPEGVSFAILLMNSFTPLINRYIRPRIFGERRNRK